MTTKINENTNVQLDLKTIGIIIAGTISLASIWFTLQGEIKNINNKIESFTGEEFVQKMEFNLKDELVRSTIIQIEKATETLKEDIIENKDAIKLNSDKIYENHKRR